ncbi:MAG: hypothetical protein ACREBH_04170 [Candidatus Micrarchaeaceae archaeon]
MDPLSHTDMAAYAASVLSSIKKVEADADWDGISAAVQVKRNFPEVDIKISDQKDVPSDISTLVLDKGTYGDGWVVDHHPSSVNCRNIFRFCPNGEVPTSTLIYNTLQKRDEQGLMLSASAEISDGLYEYGSAHGSLKALYGAYPNYFKRSRSHSQCMVDKEIYVMADIFSVLSFNMPQSAFRIGLDVYDSKPKDSAGLVSLLQNDEKKLISEYFSFMDGNIDMFRQHRLLGREVLVGDGTKTSRFAYAALGKALVNRPGNYMLFMGDKMSVRTDDSGLFDLILERLNGKVSASGGRMGWYGLKFSERMSYGELMGRLAG